jgi:ABC-type spermidine/putrescine transport system permease subunit II|nr:ABC transporter permease [Rhodospirillales bacterium]
MHKTNTEHLIDVFLGLITAGTFFVLYMPIVVNSIFSLVPSDRNGIHWGEASFEWYWRLLENESVIAAIKTTLIVSVIAVAIAAILAIILAIYVEWEGAVFQRTIELVVYIPFLMPPIITGLSLLMFFDRIGISRGEATIIVGHTALVLAVLYRLVLTRLRAMPHTLVEASADLGATRLQTFRYVVWPQLRPAVITGAVLAMAVSFDETLITVFLAGDTTTIPLRLWGMMRVGFKPEINALVTIVLLVSIIMAVITAIRIKPAEGNEE